MIQPVIDPTVQQLLDELNESSYLERQKQIANSLHPYNDIAIPLLINRLEDKSDNYYIKENALEVLALSAEPRAILPVIRYIEIETGWTGHIFDYLRQGLKEQAELNQQKAKDQLIKYLEDGPKVPVPEPFDPVESQNSFMDVVAALMKQTGVTDLDEESAKLVEEMKESYGKPIDLSEYEKDRIPEYQNIIVEVIDTLSEFGGLQDLRLPALLSRQITEYGFPSIAAQHALTALSKIDVSLALAQLSELNSSAQTQSDDTLKRVVTNHLGQAVEIFDFAICTRKPSDATLIERPYYFKFEKGLIYFKARGEESYLWFVGQASNNNQAIQVATRYLERWIKSIDTLDVLRTQTGKYSRIHGADRYAECINLLQSHIALEKWGFHQTHISQIYEYPLECPQIIYDSEWCRIKLAFHSYGEMYDQSDVLSIQYGRLHAADKEDSILWNGQPHHCWHRIDLALCFLDGMTTEEAAQVLWSHPLLKRGHTLPQPVEEAETHNLIWEHYGQKLFELFDLRRPELWERFSAFVKQVYILKDFKYYGNGIPHEKIC